MIFLKYLQGRFSKRHRLRSGGMLALIDAIISVGVLSIAFNVFTLPVLICVGIVLFGILFSFAKHYMLYKASYNFNFQMDLDSSNLTNMNYSCSFNTLFKKEDGDLYVNLEFDRNDNDIDYDIDYDSDSVISDAEIGRQKPNK